MTAASENLSAEESLARVFKLDSLFDAMISGRLCGKKVDGGIAQILLVLLERIGWKPNVAELAHAMPHYPEHFGLAEIRSAMANLGYLSAIMPVLGSRLQLCPKCTLVCDETGELWLVRATNKGVELFQPGDLEQTKHVQANALYRTIQFETRGFGSLTASNRGANWAGGVLFRFRSELATLFILTVFSGLIVILVAFGVKTVFDTIIPSRNTETLRAVIIGLGLVALAELMFRRIRANALSRVAGRIEYILGTTLFGKLMRLPAAMLTNASESEQFARFKQFETLREVFGGPIVLLVLELGVAALLLVAIAMIAWQLSLFLVGLALLFLVIAMALRPAIGRANGALSAAQSRFQAANSELFACRKSIRRRGLYDAFSERQRDALRSLIRARRKLSLEVRLLDSLALVSLPFAGASAIGVGALLVMQGSLSAGQLIAVTILTWRLFAPIQQVILVLPKLPELRRLLNQVDLFFKIPEEPKGQPSDVTRPCRGDVAISNLVVRFPGAILPTLVGGEFKIPAGKLIAVTGPSGSGKSTLLRVLSGSLAPQSGVVMVDGLNVLQLSQGYRNRHIARVSQEPIIIFGTVAQNLRLAAPGASDAHIEEVLEELGLDTWVSTLSDGINTRIDPTTMTDVLSPGIRTLLSVAQALLADPAILLLDEPVGGLDAVREAYLVHALLSRRGKMTTFLVTHRPSLISQSDGLIYLEGGAIRFGRPQALERATA